MTKDQQVYIDYLNPPYNDFLQIKYRNQRAVISCLEKKEHYKVNVVLCNFIKQRDHDVLSDLVKTSLTYQEALEYAHQLAQDIAKAFCSEEHEEFRAQSIVNNTSLEKCVQSQPKCTEKPLDTTLF